MSPRMNALRAGAARGLTLFRHTLTTSDGIASTVIWNAVPVAYLVISRDSTFPGTDLPMATVLLPGMIGMIVVLSTMFGPAYYLSAEREDGTLLRAKAVPHGMLGYVTGLCVLACCETGLTILAVLGTSLLFLSDVTLGVGGLTTLVGWILLGLAASLPIGILIGTLARSPRAVSGWGISLMTGLAAISGIFFPLQALWGWVQVVAQALPVYWAALGVRSAFLPDEAAVNEVGESWRTLEALGVLGIWAVAGFVLAPILLRRMARRESGSSVEERRQQALQRI